MADKIDEVRNAFFAKVKEDEENKQKAVEEKQSLCAHVFDGLGRPSGPNNLQSRICNKCNYHKVLPTKEWKILTGR